MSIFNTIRLIIALSFVIHIHHGTSVYCWENAELEMYDLVEEVGKNFYEVLGLAEDANSKEIKQAYRKLSVKIHPDKNDAPDADVQFRQLVGIYEVLKDTDLRKEYNRVLVEGLPNWRQPIFYFRRARKLAIWQVTIIVLAIVSVGQYLAGWASYFERKLSIHEKLDSERRRATRTRKAKKEGPSLEECSAEIEMYLQRPSLWDIAPIQICRFSKYMVISFPFELAEYIRQVKEEREQKAKELLEQEIVEAIVKEPKKPRKRKVVEIPEKDETEAGQTQWGSHAVDPINEYKKPIIKGGLWTDDDISELTKLCQRFPGGTSDRWEKIADQLCRPAQEVTFMAKKVLERLSQKQAEEDQGPPVKVKVKTKGVKLESLSTDSVANWSAEEQKALEHALQMYPKGALDRWDKIANMVPGRSKDECTQRFKYLAELVKKKREESKEKSAEEESQDQTNAEPNHEKESLLPANFTTESEKDEGSLEQREASNSIRNLDVGTPKESIERQHSSSSSNSNSDNDWCVIDNPRPP